MAVDGGSVGSHLEPPPPGVVCLINDDRERDAVSSQETMDTLFASDANAILGGRLDNVMLATTTVVAVVDSSPIPQIPQHSSFG